MTRILDVVKKKLPKNIRQISTVRQSLLELFTIMSETLPYVREIELLKLIKRIQPVHHQEEVQIGPQELLH